MTETFGVLAPHPPIMVEAVGRERSSATAASAAGLRRAAAALARFDPDVVVVTSPHAPSVFDAFAVDTSAELRGTFAQFGAGHASFSYRGHPSFARDVINCLNERGLSAIERDADQRLACGVLDHGVMVPLSFLDPTGRWPLVVISYSGADSASYALLGEAIRTAADAASLRVAMVASGDLSHRLTPDAPAGYSPKASDLDIAIVSSVRDGMLRALSDLPPDLVEAGGECGLRSFIALGGFAGPDPTPTHVLAYEGPWGVGYLTALVGHDALSLDAETATTESGYKGGMPSDEETEPVTLARAAIEAYVAEGRRLEPTPLSDPNLPGSAGAFVSLHSNGQLRGCIGTIVPTRDTLADEIAHNAIQAATTDPRFPPVRAGELGELDIKVDVLQPPEACRLEDLDPSTYGVIVSSGWRRGLLLPDLQGVDDVRTQIDIAMQKGGIRSGEPCRYERFRVDRYT